VAPEALIEDRVLSELLLYFIQVAGDEGHVVHVGQGLFKVLCEGGREGGRGWSEWWGFSTSLGCG